MDTKKLRQKILDLAIRGKLVKQDANEEPANVLLARIRKEKERLVKEGKLKKKDLVTTPVSDEDKPFGVPEGWEWCRIKDVCSKIVDGDHNPPKGEKSPTGYYMLSSKNINNNTIVDKEDCRHLSYKNWSLCNSRTQLQRGDILLTTVASLGRSCILEENTPYCFQRSVTVFTTLIYNYYLKYVFDSSYYQIHMEKNARGTAQKGFYLNQVETSLIPLPPLSEQQRIVAEVEKWMSLIDTIENGKENLLQSIATAKSKILDLAVKGKLVPQDANDEPAGMLLMRIGCKYIESDKESPFKLPSSWIWTNMNGCNKYKSLSINPSKSPDKDYELYSVPTFETGMPEFIKGERISSSKKRVEKGDVLLCKINPHLNRAWEVSHHKPQRTCIASSEWIIFRNNNINAKYLIHCFQSPYFKKLMLSNVSGVGGSLMRAQPACVLKYPFPLPPLSEQQRIVTKIEQIFAQLDSIAAAIKS